MQSISFMVVRLVRLFADLFSTFERFRSDKISSFSIKILRILKVMHLSLILVMEKNICYKTGVVTL